jgi:hypothetical protein
LAGQKSAAPQRTITLLLSSGRYSTPLDRSRPNSRSIPSWKTNCRSTFVLSNHRKLALLIDRSRGVMSKSAPAFTSHRPGFTKLLCPWILLDRRSGIRLFRCETFTPKSGTCCRCQ